jgi:hypothetical protein
MDKASHTGTRGRTMKRILVLLTLATMGIIGNVTTAQAEVIANEQVSLAFAGFLSCANGGTARFSPARSKRTT